MGPETWITGELHQTLTPTVNPVRVRSGDNCSSCLPHPQGSQSRPPSLSPAPHPPQFYPPSAWRALQVSVVFSLLYLSRVTSGAGSEPLTGVVAVWAQPFVTSSGVQPFCVAARGAKLLFSQGKVGLPCIRLFAGIMAS